VVKIARWNYNDNCDCPRIELKSSPYGYDFNVAHSNKCVRDHMSKKDYEQNPISASKLASPLSHAKYTKGNNPGYEFKNKGRKAKGIMLKSEVPIDSKGRPIIKATKDRIKEYAR
jgi:hypothetical protein